jgi:hypothetical protein
MTEKVRSCAHPACQCEVSEEAEFCGEYCKDAGKHDLEISCDCGHEGCAFSEKYQRSFATHVPEKVG